MSQNEQSLDRPDMVWGWQDPHRWLYSIGQKIGDHLANMIRGVGVFLEERLANDYPATYSQSKWEIFLMGAIP
ncbi:hypothetical protein LL998_02470 [Burkholderia ambifaria]|uniref:hypothetical protein n=1 Tax=Burkholderia ambifaria TaxID=152480 RepID=UPI001E2A6408|nr:hypothetical protein [Burkholderia ambifaria]UEP35176.1 hypothetical protein LL998_02470 [Burkholderia ambifaria]